MRAASFQEDMVDSDNIKFNILSEADVKKWNCGMTETTLGGQTVGK